jgi:hypothetical protein
VYHLPTGANVVYLRQIEYDTREKIMPKDISAFRVLEIRVLAGHVHNPGQENGELVSEHTGDVGACNELLRIADNARANGGTVSGAGYVLYVTRIDGTEWTYRVWERW